MAQCKRCAICLRKLKLKGKRSYLSPQLDHCHKTGRVRGILCRTCNFRIVPVFEKDFQRIDMLSYYLKRDIDWRDI